MAAVTIRNLPDEVLRALKQRAALHQRSAEAEMRAILAEAVSPQERVRLGTTLSQLSRSAGITDAEVDAIESVRDRTPAIPINME